MLTKIKQFFDSYLAPIQDDDSTVSTHALQLATAALLIEMMRMDEEIRPEERRAVAGSIQDKFDLSDQETETLIQLAEEEAAQATDYHQFTSLINKGFTLEQKILVIEYLWEVAYADAHLDMYEEHLVRKVAELLYIPHSAFISAKHRVMPSK